jgi:hypothetical protein
VREEATVGMKKRETPHECNTRGVEAHFAARDGGIAGAGTVDVRSAFCSCRL